MNRLIHDLNCRIDNHKDKSGKMPTRIELGHVKYAEHEALRNSKEWDTQHITLDANGRLHYKELPVKISPERANHVQVN